MHSIRLSGRGARFAAAALGLTAWVALATLTGCGGGTTPGPSTTTYTAAKACWDASKPTSTVSQADADNKVPANCPAVTTASLKVAVAADGKLSLTGLPAGTTLTGGTLVATPGNVNLTLNPDGTITPATALAPSTAYTAAGTLKLANGPDTSVSLPFTTPAAPVTACAAPSQLNAYNVCMPPPVKGSFTKDANGKEVACDASCFTWNTTAKVWMANIGVKITDPQDIGETLYVTNTYNLNDGDLWKKYSADGTIKFAMSNIVIPSEPTRKVMFAYFTTTKGTNGVKVYQRFTVWQDGNMAAWINPPVGNGGFEEASDYSYGTKDGFVTHSASGCWEKYFTNNTFSVRRAACNY